MPRYREKHFIVVEKIKVLNSTVCLNVRKEPFWHKQTLKALVGPESSLAININFKTKKTIDNMITPSIV